MTATCDLRSPHVVSTTFHDADDTDSIGGHSQGTKSFNSKSSSVLSYQDTLDLYRTNAKKTNDSVTQFNFAKYLIDASVVAEELEGSEMTESSVETGTTDGSAGSVSGQSCSGKLSGKKALQSEGIKWMKRLANQSSGLGRPPLPEAQYYLAECYFLGTLGLSQDYDKSFSLYVQASKQNHPESSYKAALAYELGQGTKRDPGRAVQFYRKAAALGDPYAMHRIALILQHGLLGQAKNPREAVTWLKRAAALASETYPQPLHDLALCYEKGGSSAVIPDEAYAYELFLKAANLNYAPSQCKIGAAHEFGLLGCPLDPGLSIKWYAKSAEQGNPEAELALSGWYLTGAEGILRQSPPEAYTWARKAADQGFAKAEYAVGHYSEAGIGVQPDVEESKRWYARAAAQGNKRALARLDEIKKLSKANKNAKSLHANKKESDCRVF